MAIQAGVWTAAGFTFLLAAVFASMAAAENQGSLRFHGSGVNQLDRVRIQIAEAPVPSRANIGSGSFTIDLWVRGTLAQNNSPLRPPGEYSDFDWILGNIIVDRDIWSDDPAARRKFGISLAGGRVEFGTDRGLTDPSSHTLVANPNVLDGQWRHIAATRDAATGIKRVFVDGLLVATSQAGVSTADLSFPSTSIPNQVEPCGTGPWGPYIVLAAEKHDADQHLTPNGCMVPPTAFDYPSFNGWLDEVRVWNRALEAEEISLVFDKILPDDYPGLQGYWRFEEGAGLLVSDQVANGTSGELLPAPGPLENWSNEAAPVTLLVSPMTPGDLIWLH